LNPDKDERMKNKMKSALFAMLVMTFLPLSSAAEEQYWLYTVRPGDNIWNLAERHTTSALNWKYLQRVNNIPDGPDRRIKPGTRLRFPVSILKHQPAQAVLVRVAGAAQVVRAGTVDEVPATLGMGLNTGDKVLTNLQSNLLIRFADGSEMVVQSDSELSMDSLSAYGSTGMVDTRVRLKSGQIETQVRPARGPGSRYEIITPAAVAAVRGTDFRVSAEKTAVVARTEVLEGQVKVGGDHGATNVNEGFGVVAEAGKPPGKAVVLLPGPSLDGIDTLQTQLPLLFDWQRLNGAQRYRFQISTDSQFKSLLANELSLTDKGWWQDLPDGKYHLRVRGIDAQGLEGKNTDTAFSVAARPFAPVLQTLVGGVVVREAQPEFDWTRPPGVDRYHLQVAANATFAEPLIDNRNLDKNRYRPESAMPPGVYFWRMRSVDDNGKSGPYSDVQRFEYKLIPPSPAVDQPDISDNELSLSWQSAGIDMVYRYQLASDAKFRHIVNEGEIAEPIVILKKPRAGHYYFRVQAVDSSGYAGPYGPQQLIKLTPDSYWPLLVPLLVMFL
jgi:hypothetical protein